MKIPVPEFMQHLPLTDRGYLKPWFVKGDDFRVVDGEKAWLSVNKKACWICGQPFKPNEYAMVGDANSAFHRIYAEPPCHVECAQYAAQVCPFMLYPNAKRRLAGLSHEQTLAYRNENQQVLVEEENPGEYYITVVTDFDYHHAQQVTAFTPDKIVETQYWIGGVRQEKVPDPKPT